MLATSSVSVLNVNDGQEGAPGAQGPQGISVIGSREQWFLSTSNTGLTGSPNTIDVNGVSVLVGQWTYTEPAVIPDGYYLWGRIENTFARIDDAEIASSDGLLVSSDGTLVCGYYSSPVPQYSDAIYRSVISGIKSMVDYNRKAITDKVWETDIENHVYGADDGDGGYTMSSISDRVTQTEQDISGITTTVSEVQSQVDNKADGSTVQTLSENFSTFQQTMSGFKTTVESNYATKVDIDNIKVSGNNLYIIKDQVPGFLNQSGGVSAPSSTNKEKTSAYIPVAPGETYVIQAWATPNTSGQSWLGYQFFTDKNESAKIGNRVAKYGSASSGGAEITAEGQERLMYKTVAPGTAKYLRVSYRQFDDGYAMVEQATTPSEYAIATADLQNESSQIRTIAEQTAEGFSWIVQDGSSASNVTYTSNALTAMANQIDLTGKVTFNSMDTTLKTRITTAEDNASTAKAQASTANTTANTAKNILDSWKGEAEAGVTTINGGLIQTNTIKTKHLATDAIKSSNYSPNDSSVYSLGGTFLDLANGNITSPTFAVDNTNGTAYIDGTISARNLLVGTAAAELSASAGTLNSSQGALVGNALDAAGDYLIYDGESIYIKTSNFGIDPAGNVTMTGEVNAASGSIGGWTISPKNLHYGSSVGSEGSVYLIPEGSMSYHTVGGSPEMSGWVITAGDSFGVTNNGSLYANDANITGTFTITDGGIGGMTIDSDSVYGSTAGMSSNQAKWAFWAGETNGKHGASDTNSVFKVGSNGKLYATNAEITGKITAQSGTIGGWKITSDSLYYYTDDTVPQVGTANSVFLCPEGSSTKKSIGGSPSTTNGWVFTAGTGFGVTRTGAVYANSGRIGGVTLSDCNIYAYNTTTTPSFQLLSTGSLAIGGTSGITVDTNGVLSIPAARITGKLTAGQIEAGALTITQLAGFDIDDDMLRTAGIDSSSIVENSITLSTTDFSRTVGNNTYAGLRFAIGSKFFVSKSGALYCTSGQIGGFSIGATHLYALDSNYANYTYLQGIGTDGSIYLGATNLIPDGTSTSNYSAVAGYKTATWRLTIGKYFGVTGRGDLYCNSGKIGVLNIDSDRLYTGTIGQDDSVFIRASNLGTASTVADYYTDKWRFTVGANFGVTGSTVYGKRIRIINTSSTKWDFTSDTSDYTFTVQNSHATDSSKRTTLKIGAAGEAGLMVKNNSSNIGGFIVTNKNEMGIINWTNASDPSWPFRYSFTNSSVYITGTHVYINGSQYTSSDERIKTIHKTLNDDHKKLFMSLKPIEYSFVDKPEERHFGLGAQTTEASMNELGFGTEYGIVSHSFNNHKNQYGMDESYYLNYTEALMLSVPVVQDHEKEIAELKTKIEELENKLSQLTQ